MKKAFLWLLVVSMVAMFPIVGCRKETIKEETAEEVEEEISEAETIEEEEEAEVEEAEEEAVAEVKTLIAFNSDRDGDYEVYIMNSDGTDLTKITDNDSNDGFPSWSLSK